ncbi:hypothetical protein ACE6H2_015874 [Prunus campanulata]
MMSMWHGSKVIMGLALLEREGLWIPMEVRDSEEEVLSVFRGFRQLGSVSVGTVAILPKYRRWRKWASKARKFAGFSGEKACSLKMVGCILFWLGRTGSIYSCRGFALLQETLVVSS